MRCFALAALFILAVLPGRAAADPAPAAQTQAETAASRQARRLLDALTTDGDPAFLAFIHQASPRSKMSDTEWLGLRSNLRKLSFHGLLAASETTADLSVFDGNRESWARIVVTVEPEPPHAIATVEIHSARRPADVPAPPRLQPDALAAALKSRLKQDARDDRFSGAVMVTKDGKTVFLGSYGLADREAHIAVTPQTQFRFGSIGKMFTEVAIMQLAQDGKLDLTAPMGRYLKDYPNAGAAAKVTIENLLSHTGGTGDIFGPEFFAERLSLHDAKDYVALYGARPLEFVPGTKFAYSNFGYILLGRIVEAVGGVSYDDYLQTHVFAPAHMDSTGMAPETVNLPRRAIGYTSGDGALKSAADTQPYRGTAAGGGYSTAGDLTRFMDAVRSGVLLHPGTFKRLTTGGVKGPDGTFYPFDFVGVTAEGERCIGHGGGAPGMNGEVRTFVDRGYTVVVLANRDPPIATAIANFISDRLP